MSFLYLTERNDCNISNSIKTGSGETRPGENKSSKNRFQKNKNKKRPSPTLRPKEENLARGFSFHAGKGILWNIKGTPPFTSKKEGSMTVEAAIVLPLLLFFFLSLFSSIEMIRLHGNLQSAIWETGRQMAVYGYVYDQAGDETERGELLGKLGGIFLSQTVVKSSVVHYLGEEYLEESPLKYGKNGLNFLESDLMQEGDNIDIKVTYQVTPWTALIGIPSFRMGNRYFGRAWTGYDLSGGGADKEDFVFVTESGSVYHETLNCTYLKRTILTVPLAEVSFRRNQSGRSYRRCEICGFRREGNEVFLTPDGERYHSVTDCPALKRTIHKMLRKEAESRYNACSRCGGGNIK